MEISKVCSRMVLCLFLSLVMMILTSPQAGAVTVDGGYQDGICQGTGRGRNGDITLSVAIVDGKITSIENVSNRETPRYWEKAIQLFDDILEKNGTDGVDTVSGATLSSRGILAAVQDAIEKASSYETEDPSSDPEVIDPSIFASGSGTQEDPYIVQTEEQMKAFALSMNPSIDYSGKYVRLDADLDLSGENWTPAGGSFYRFDGVFDGNGRIISGLTEGSSESPLELDGNHSCIGLFGWLNEHAVVRDLTLDNVAIYTNSPGSAYIGGIAGRMSGSETEGDYHGARIDGCVVRGLITHTTDAGTTFVGGICGHVFKGSIINSWTGTELTCIEKSGELAEVGGIAGLLNRGLIANCYSLGGITGSGYRDTQRDIEGMACVGNIAAVDGGNIVNCYGEGDVEALEYSIDTGLIAGWVTGIGKAYHCWYNENAKMTIDGRKVSPVDPFGEVVAGGVSDEYYFRFPGALTTKIRGYHAGSSTDIQKLADGLNASFSAFPIDITGLYGLPGNALKNWVSDGEHAVLGTEAMEVHYVRPEVENNLHEDAPLTLKDGKWYGRSEDQETVVQISIQNGEIVNTSVVKGQGSGDGFDQAEARARFKALYGDTTDYFPADLSAFKGQGTEASPYLIENEAQLRYIASSINEDNDWYGTWFRQTQDIVVSDEEWKPIGWGIFADADNDGFGQDVVALYPFRGHYDGDDHIISGLKAGSAEEPVHAHYMGLFGIIQGDYTGNEIPQDAERAELKNIRLENVEFHTENRWRSYIGGLTGNAQGGFSISRCSVNGGLISSRSTEDFAFAGGLAGSLMYGCVSDSWTDLDLTAYSGKNYSYAGGMAATTNRATLINSYSLSDVHADADQTNRAEAGGFTGLDGGVCVNCYARGSVEILSRYSMYLGGFSGMAASSSEHRLCYYNCDADQKIAGTLLSEDERKYAGKLVNESPEAESQAQTESAMSSMSFVDLLNHNLSNLPVTVAEVRETLGADENGSSRYESFYYNGNGSDLMRWSLEQGLAVFKNHCPADRFKDVDTGLWYHEGIDYVLENQIMNGVSEDEFAPDIMTTRAMLVTVLHRLDGSKTAGASSFKDVDSCSWYESAVNWAAENGIVKGYSEDEFGPDDFITREQMVTIFYRYSLYRGIEVSRMANLDHFTDQYQVSEYAVTPMAWAVNAKLINGMTETTLVPQGGAARAQVAALIMRFCEKTV